MNAETFSSSALDSVEFSPDPAVCVSYQISPAKLLSMSAQYGAATKLLLSLENGTETKDVKEVPNETSPLVATYIKHPNISYSMKLNYENTRAIINDTRKRWCFESYGILYLFNNNCNSNKIPGVVIYCIAETFRGIRFLSKQ